MKRIIVLTLSILFLFVSISAASTITLRWDRNSETDLAGYKVWITDTPGNYGWTLGNAPYQSHGPSEITHPNLAAILPVTVVNSTDIAEHPNEATVTVGDGHHYFVVTAFDRPLATGSVPNPEVTPVHVTGSYNESGNSNEVDQIIDTGAPGSPGGLTIWEVILAIWNWLRNIFAV